MYPEQTRRSFLASSVLVSTGIGLAAQVRAAESAPQTDINAVQLKPGEKRDLPLKLSVTYPRDFPVSGLE